MEYWYLWLILVVLCIVTVFVLAKAGSAAKLHNSDRDKMLKKLDRMKALKEEFTDLTAEKAESSDPEVLIDGVAAVLQSKVEKAEAPEKAFCDFSPAQKNIYTLNYFLEDTAKNGLSFFFKNNGEPLISLVVPALSAVGTECCDTVSTEFDMFDENNETASLDKEKLKELDEFFAANFERQNEILKIKEYIIKNVAELNL